MRFQRMMLCVLLALPALLAGCVPVSLPTATPFVSPSAPSEGGAVSPLAAPAAPACIGPADVAAHEGEAVCLQAVVETTENRGNDFIMWMGKDDARLYIAVHNTFYVGSEGSCMRITGAVQKDAEGQLYIRADDPGQVAPCD